MAWFVEAGEITGEKSRGLEEHPDSARAAATAINVGRFMDRLPGAARLCKGMLCSLTDAVK
jgi:hypothetical protein